MDYVRNFKDMEAQGMYVRPYGEEYMAIAFNESGETLFEAFGVSERELARSVNNCLRFMDDDPSGE